MTAPAGQDDESFHDALVLQYPRWHSALEFVQGAFSAIVCVWLIMSFEPGLVFAGVLVLLLLGFVWFAYRALLRWRFSARLQTPKIVSSAGKSVLELDRLSELSLTYYSTRRDSRSGWYRLKLKSPSSTFEAESKMLGFDVLVETAAACAEANDLTLDDITRENLAQFRATVKPSLQPLSLD